MNEINANATFQPSSDYKVQVLDGEAILLNVRTGAYFGANKVGTAIWDLYSQGLSMQEVTARIVERFEVGQEQAEKDVLAYTRLLLDKGLLLK